MNIKGNRKELMWRKGRGLKDLRNTDRKTEHIMTNEEGSETIKVCKE